MKVIGELHSRVLLPKNFQDYVPIHWIGKCEDAFTLDIRQDSRCNVQSSIILDVDKIVGKMPKLGKSLSFEKLDNEAKR